MIMVESTPEGFGRIAAQTAKQVILQRIREAERDAQYNLYAEREGEIINGVVQSMGQMGITLNLGRTEALLPKKEQVPGERYQLHQRLRAYVVEAPKRGAKFLVIRRRRSCSRFFPTKICAVSAKRSRRLPRSVLLPKIRSERAAAPAELAKIFSIITPSLPHSITSTIGDALEIARAKPNPILITGSLHFAGEVLAHLHGSTSRVRRMRAIMRPKTRGWVAHASRVLVSASRRNTLS